MPRRRLPMIGAVLLILAYIAVVFIPALRRAFELMSLPPLLYIVIGSATAIWTVVRREAWPGRWLERFLGL